MKKLMTAVLAVCPKVRGSASDLRQVDVRSRHCAQCPPQPDKRNGAGAEAPEGGDPRVRSPWLTRMHGTCLQTSSRATCCHARELKVGFQVAAARG
jgi:hypothetical protein